MSCVYVFFFFNDTATTEIYTLSLHDALPISRRLVQIPPYGGSRGGCEPSQRAHAAVQLAVWCLGVGGFGPRGARAPSRRGAGGRKSTRLNSSHANISYSVFCLKKKKNNMIDQ